VRSVWLLMAWMSVSNCVAEAEGSLRVRLSWCRALAVFCMSAFLPWFVVCFIVTAGSGGAFTLGGGGN